MELTVSSADKKKGGVHNKLHRIILERLITDKKFRESFFKRPESSPKIVGIAINQKELYELKNTDYSDYMDGKLGFDDDEVMRCYSVN